MGGIVMFKLFKAKLVVALAAVGLALGARAITNEEIQYYLWCEYLDFTWSGDVSVVYDYGYAVKITAEGQDKYSELVTQVYGPCLLGYKVKSSTTDGSSAYLSIKDPENYFSSVRLEDYTSYEDIVDVVSDEGLNVLSWRASTPVAGGSASLTLHPLSVWPRVTFDMTGCTGTAPDLTADPLNDEERIKIHTDGNTYARVGKRIKLPATATTFSKNGCTLTGWYVRRANAERDDFYTPGDFVTMTLEPITIRPSWIGNEHNETSGYAARVEYYNDAIGCDQLNFFSWGWQAGEGAGGDASIQDFKANHTIEIMADGSGCKTHLGASFEGPCYLEYKWKGTASGGDASDKPYFHTEIYRDGDDFNVVKYERYNNEFSSTSEGLTCDAKNEYEFGKDKDILTVIWETDNSNYSGKTTLTLGGVVYYPVLKVNLSSADSILDEHNSVAYWGSGVSAKEYWFSNYCFKPGVVITLPGAENIKFSKDGYHLAGWEIDGTDYAIGANYTMPGRPVEMKPIWEEGGELKQLLGCDYLDFTSATVGGGKVNNTAGTDFLRLEASGNNGLAEIGSGVKGPCYIGYTWVGEANTDYAEGYFKYQDALTLQTETVTHALDGTISPMVLLPLAQDYSITWGVTTQGAGASAAAHVDLSNVTVYPGIMFDYGGATGAAQSLTDVQEEEGLVFEDSGIYFAAVGSRITLPGPGTLAKEGYNFSCWLIDGSVYRSAGQTYKIDEAKPITIEPVWRPDYGKYVNCDYLNFFDFTTGNASVDVDTVQNQVCLAALEEYSEACLYTGNDSVAGPGIVKYDWNGRQNTTGGYAQFSVFDYYYWETVVEQYYNKLGTETTSGSAIAYLPECHDYQIQWWACSAGGGTYWNLSDISYWPRVTFNGGDATGEAPKLSDVPANMATFCMTGEDGYSYAKAKSWIILPGAGSFSKAGYHLAGWKIGGVEYVVGALLQMPVEPITANAIWVEGEEEEPETEWPGLVYDDDTEFGAKGAWNGYFIDDNGVVVGTINIKAGAFKKGKSAATFTVTLWNKKSFKIKSNVIRDDINGYWTNASVKGGNWVEAFFTHENVYGWVNGIFFDAGRDFSSDKGAAAAAFKKKLDGAKKDFVLAGTSTPLSGKTDLQNGYIGVTVNIGAKGKLKFSGVLPDGNKISGKGVALVDSRGVYVPLWTQVASKKGYFGGQMISADTLQPLRNPTGWWIAPQIESVFDFVDAQLLKNSKPTASCTLWALGAPEAIDGKALDATTIPGWSEPMALTFKGKAWTTTSANPGKLKLTYVPKTGLIKGSFTALSGKKKFKATINGAYVGKEGFANAFFKGKRSFGIWME